MDVLYHLFFLIKKEAEASFGNEQNLHTEQNSLDMEVGKVIFCLQKYMPIRYFLLVLFVRFGECNPRRCLVRRS